MVKRVMVEFGLLVYNGRMGQPSSFATLQHPAADWLSQRPFGWYDAERAVVIGLLVAAAVLVARTLWLARPTWPRAVVPALFGLLGLAGWLWLLQPAFVHAEFYGPELVNDILLGASPPQHPHGATSYVLLNWLAGLQRLLPATDPVVAVMRANALLAALSAWPLAALAARWTGDSRAGWLAALLWFTSPLVARLAYSEEAAISAVFFGLLALWAADRAATEPAPRLQGLAMVAALLAVFSRQTAAALLPAVVLVAVARDRQQSCWQRWRFPGILAAVLVAGLAMQAVVRPRQGFDVLWLALGVFDMAALWQCLRGHPLVDVGQLPALMPFLAIVGAWALVRRPGAGLAWATGLVATALTSLPAAWPVAGARWGFRLPAVVLGLLAAAVGALAVVQYLQVRLRPPIALAAVAVAVALTAGLAPQTWQNQREDPVLIDYLWLRAQLSRHSDAPIAVVDWRFPQPRYHSVAEAARSLGRPTQPPGAGAYFAESLGCWTYTVAELAIPASTDEPAAMDYLAGHPQRLHQLLFDVSAEFGLADVRVPSEPRRECARWLLGAELVATGPTVAVAGLPPDAVPARPQVPLRLWRLPPVQRPPLDSPGSRIKP